MISEQEARRSGPIADYLALSRMLDTEIWRSIYAGRTRRSLVDVCELAELSYYAVYGTEWYSLLINELEALGYEVSAEGIVSW